jgi:Rrf2 family protein
MAAVNTQFSIAVHMMAGLGMNPDGTMTSNHLAGSVNACPSFVRRVMSKLSKAGLVQTTTGKTGSCCLAKKAKDISLLEIYEAVEAPKVFAIHQYPDQKSCKISCRIKPAMEKILDNTQKQMEENLKKVSLQDVIADIRRE